MRLKRHIPIIAVSLILALVAGPLSAQTMFRCEMMDEAPATSCCCEDQLRCDEFDDGVQAVEPGGCCAISLERHVDNNPGHATAIVHRIDVPSNVDPPSPGIVDILLLSPASPCARNTIRGTVTHLSAGTRTYLTTQRLRI